MPSILFLEEIGAFRKKNDIILNIEILARMTVTLSTTYIVVFWAKRVFLILKFPEILLSEFIIQSHVSNNFHQTWRIPGDGYANRRRLEDGVFLSSIE